MFEEISFEGVSLLNRMFLMLEKLDICVMTANVNDNGYVYIRVWKVMDGNGRYLKTSYRTRIKVV